MRMGIRIKNAMAAAVWVATLSALPVWALDIGGNVSGTVSDAGEIRLTNDVTLTGNTVLKADSDGSGDDIINIQGFAINGGGFDLTLHSGADVTLGVLTNVDTLALQSSDGNPVTYTSAVANAFAAVTVRNDGADYGDVIFARPETAGGFFLIHDLSQLQDIDSGVLTTNYRMANHIDATATTQSTWNAGLGFDPIGNATSSFEGDFDGNAKIISSMYIAGTSNLGLFARTENAYIYDLGLTNVEVVTVGVPGRHFGAIAGRSTTGGSTGIVLSNVYATGTITSTNIPTRLGGLIGYAEHASVKDSYSSIAIAVTGTGGDIGGIVGTLLFGGVLNSHSEGNTLCDTAWRVGGVVGTLDGGGVIDSYNEGTVQGGTHVGGGVGFAIRGSKLLRSFSSGTVTSAVSGLHSETAIGGLVGLMWSSGNTSDVISSVEQCYSTGSVFAGGDNHRTVGGLVGGAWRSQVLDSYAVGDVTTGTNAASVGGLIGGASDVYCCGFNIQTLDIQRAYSTGLVVVGTASIGVGGLIGTYTNANGSMLTNNYWNTNSSGISASTGGVGNGDYSGGLVDGLSTPEMTNSNSYAGWDFTAGTGVWEVEQGHRPHLQWEAFNFAGGGGRRAAC